MRIPFLNSAVKLGRDVSGCVVVAVASSPDAAGESVIHTNQNNTLTQ